jgi:hypothetical protein
MALVVSEGRVELAVSGGSAGGASSGGTRSSVIVTPGHVSYFDAETESVLFPSDAEGLALYPDVPEMTASGAQDGAMFTPPVISAPGVGEPRSFFGSIEWP